MPARLGLWLTAADERGNWGRGLGPAGLSAIKINDRVGLLIFTDEVEVFVPPKKAQARAARAARVAVLSAAGHKTSIAGALEYLSRVLHRRSVIFVISDFLDQGYEPHCVT